MKQVAFLTDWKNQYLTPFQIISKNNRINYRAKKIGTLIRQAKGNDDEHILESVLDPTRSKQ